VATIVGPIPVPVVPVIRPIAIAVIIGPVVIGVPVIVTGIESEAISIAAVAIPVIVGLLDGAHLNGEAVECGPGRCMGLAHSKSHAKDTGDGKEIREEVTHFWFS
jgi:hypothetical protein